MRVALLTQWYPPERIKLPLVIAEGLVGLGHEVDVLTGFPNYPGGDIISPYRQRPYLRETSASGVTVHRTALYPSHDRSAARRAANYLSWTASSSAVAATALPTPDAFLVYSSPVTASLPAIAAGPRRRIPTALLLQDLWPDSVIGSGMADGVLGRGLQTVMGSASRGLYKRADAIGIISPGMREVLISRGIEPSRVHDTPNWVDTRHLRADARPRPERRAELGLPTSGRIFMYAGNLGPLQRLEPLVDAFAWLEGAELVLLGDGIARQQLQRRVDELRARNVHLPGACPPEDVGEFLSQADVLILSLDDTPLLRVTMPSKVQTYLAAGRPVLAHASGDAADVIVDSGAGFGATPGDTGAIRRAATTFMSADESQLLSMGRAGARRYGDHLAQQHGLHRLSNLLDAACATHRARTSQ